MVQRSVFASFPWCKGGAFLSLGKIAAFASVTFTFVCFLAASAHAQVSVLTQNADPARDAVYSNETQLTPTSTIHKLFTMSLDDPVKGQALILGGATNMLFVTTSPAESSGSASAYAFNADTGAQLWHVSFGTGAPWNTGAPVLDPNLGPHGALFVLTKGNSSQSNQLHALDVLTGSELTGSPVTLSASMGGDSFDSGQENDRAALLDVDGTIYAAFSHQNDNGTYHGWLIGYKYTSGSGFSQNGVWCDTCSGGNQGGIWQGGDGVVYDGTHIYVATGNGSIGGSNHSMSIVQLSPSSLGTVESSFLQPNAASESSADHDLNGGGMAIIPGTGGKIFIGPSKSGNMFLVNSGDLGAGAINTYSANDTVGHSPIGWNSGSAQYVYVWPNGSKIEQFCYSGGSTGSGPCHESSFSNGGTLAISSAPDGSNAILWAFGGSELHAMNPANVSAGDYWNSSMSSGDSPGGGPAHFGFIAIANGKVYIPTGNSLIAYGTTGSSACSASPNAPAGLTASNTTSSGTSLSWSAVTPPANCSISSYTVLEDGSAKANPSGTSYTVTGLSPSTTYSFTVEASDSHGTSGPSSPVSVTTLPASSCNAAPSAPTGLSSSHTTSSGTTLSWSAVTPPANCSISSYTVLENGSSIATTSSTSYAVTGLAASTTYSFTVEASDSEGTSGPSSPLSVTTSPGSTGGSVTLSPSSFNFGSTAPGTGTAWETFTLTNSGSSAVSISSVTVTGPFVLYSNCGSSVAAASSCPIYVYFAPTAAGSFTGTLTVNDSGTQTAALSGTGS